MKRVGVIAVVAGAALGCAAQKQEQAAPVQQPKAAPAKVRITNFNYFDLGTCFPSTVEVPKAVTSESLTGLLLGAKPELDECFVDPASRGANAVTRATLGATVGTGGVELKVQGDGLTDAAKSCMTNALKARTSGIEPLPATEKPVTAEIDYAHDAELNPSVTMGVNELSDVVAQIRLAQPKWCDCFEPWHNKPPHSFGGELVLPKASPTPTSVSFDPNPAEDTAKVEACLSEKLKATQFAHTKDLTVPLKFVFLHSGLSEPLQGEPADLSAMQLESIRYHDRANVLVALGGRANAVNVWNGMVTKYSSNPRAYTVKQLKDGCQALLTADDALLAAHEKARDNEQRAHDFLAAQNSPDVKTQISASEQALTQSQQDIDTAKQQRTQDAAGCPKMK